MQEHSSTLFPRQSGTTTSETEDLIRHAVVHGLCVRVTYRRNMVLIAPHILYVRDGVAFLDGVIVHHHDTRPDGTTFDTFKLTALKSIAMTSEPFAVHRDFDRTSDRYRDHVFVAIEP